jgi:hypothetical protein
MKRILLIIIILSMGLSTYSQNGVHWLINQDSITDCSFIHSGIFVNQLAECSYTKEYYIHIEDSIKTEYIGTDEYYIKSKIEYLSECKQKSTILEINYPNSLMKVGDVFYTEVVETALCDNLIKLKVTLEDSVDDRAMIVVFQKVLMEDLDKLIY